MLDNLQIKILFYYKNVAAVDFRLTSVGVIELTLCILNLKKK